IVGRRQPHRTRELYGHVSSAVRRRQRLHAMQFDVRVSLRGRNLEAYEIARTDDVRLRINAVTDQCIPGLPDTVHCRIRHRLSGARPRVFGRHEAKYVRAIRQQIERERPLSTLITSEERRRELYEPSTAGIACELRSAGEEVERK